MKILFDLTHTTADLDLFSSGHDFHVIGPWDGSQRRKPLNVTLVSEPESYYDLLVAGSMDWIRKYSKPFSRVVLKGRPGQTSPEDVEEVTRVVFSSSEDYKRAKLPQNSKVIIIEKSVDCELFQGYQGSVPEALTVGNFLPRRPEKGYEFLKNVSRRAKVRLMGAGNEDYPYNLGASKDFDHLLETYCGHRVYFNPSPVISHAVLEAMAIGMPIVTVQPTNYEDLLVNGVNCMIVSDADEAGNYIRLLLANESLCGWMGGNARKSVMFRFHPFIIKEKWGRLFQLSVNGWGGDEEVH